MTKETDDPVGVLYSGMVLQRCVHELGKVIDAKSPERDAKIDAQETVALLALATIGKDTDIEDMEKALKQYVAGQMYRARKLIEKHRDEKGERRES